jgi:DNA invertase Pin-like site-specific DNA recombinase
VAAQQAVTYLRVSGKGQRLGDGFPRQRDVISRFAKAHGYVLADEFSDTGISGTRELEDRPGLAALLDRVEHNGVKTVLVESASRLARDLMVQEVIISQLRQGGVRVVAADSGTDLTVSDDDPTRTLIRQVLGAVSQFEKSVLVLKLRAARQRIRRFRGHCEGAKSYGSYPGEAVMVERMRQLRRKPVKGRRASLAAIASTLNAEGFRNRAGRPWSLRMVFHVLKQASQHGTRKA